MESFYCLRDNSTTVTEVRHQDEQNIVDPPSIIELFKEHPSDIPRVGTVELIRTNEAVTLLVWPGVHVIAVTQNYPGGHGQACRVQHGLYMRPL